WQFVEHTRPSSEKGKNNKANLSLSTTWMTSMTKVKYTQLYCATLAHLKLEIYGTSRVSQHKPILIA
ncbi:hypothetical protein, partial [Acinetobacter baylyi]|uniref:hypothetical protein n=1 Tax=Acinetobacter baylyi TaxID=202950 RepID=UPI001C09AF6C